MINVIIPVIDNPKEYNRCIQSLATEVNIQVLVGVTEDLASQISCDYERLEVHIFPKGSRKEEIINALQSELLQGKVLICRKPFTFLEFQQFRDSEAEIAVCKTKTSNKVLDFLQKIWAKIIRLIFGVKFFDGDTSLICFHEDLYDVISNVNNFSYCSRVDRWKGISQEQIETRAPAAKQECDRKADAKLLIFAAMALLIGIITTVMLALFVHINIVIGLLLFCLDTICVSIVLLLLFTFLFNKKVGQKNFKTAVDITEDLHSDTQIDIQSTELANEMLKSQQEKIAEKIRGMEEMKADKSMPEQVKTTPKSSKPKSGLKSAVKSEKQVPKKVGKN